MRNLCTEDIVVIADAFLGTSSAVGIETDSVLRDDAEVGVNWDSYRVLCVPDVR